MFKGYRLKREVRIDEVASTLIWLEHERSGAQLLHLHNEDPENLFCLSLSTYPARSCGIAHILEHIVLCGSEHYRVKDPFFAMIGRSLNTFMNALTGSDFTLYPASSQHPEDFYNLLSVYLDAVFFPLLEKRSFLQEGHRLEWQGEGSSRRLVRCGVVYNEMKAAYTDPMRHLWMHLHANLLEDTSYAFDSGGDPKVIPQLTHEELRAFHATHYHPSRCLYFFYGNQPTQAHADFLSQRVLDQCVPLPPLPMRPLQSIWSKPRSVHGRYPAATPSAPMIAISWLTCSFQEVEKGLMMELLDLLLMGHDGAPLKKFFMHHKLCVSADSHLDKEMLQWPYTLILKETKCSAQEIVKKVLKELEQLATVGFTSEEIAQALHSLTLSRVDLESDAGSRYPLGLHLFFRSGLALQQGADPEEPLRVQGLLDALKPLIKDGQPLKDFLRRTLVENTHRLDLFLEGDLQWSQKEAQQEEEALAQLSLNAQEAEALSKQMEELAHLQTSAEDRSCLPLLPMEAVPLNPRRYPLVYHEGGLLTSPSRAPGALYSHWEWQIGSEVAQKLSAQQWHELMLLSYLWPRLGAGTRDYEQQLKAMEALSSGLDCHLQLGAKRGSAAQNPQGWMTLVFTTSSLPENTQALVRLVEELLIKGRLDEEERIIELVEELYCDEKASFPDEALSYAATLAGQALGGIHALQGWLEGLDFLLFLSEQVEALRAGKRGLLDRLRELQRLLLEHRRCSLLFLGGDQALNQAQKAIEGCSLQLTCEPAASWAVPVLGRSHPIAYLLNTQVNFLAVALPGPDPEEEPLAMALALACEVIRQGILHQKIREQGGAYGYGCSYHPESRRVSFHSYADPHLARTLAVFQEAGADMAQGKFSVQEVDEAKRCLIQRLDRPGGSLQQAAMLQRQRAGGWDERYRASLRASLLAATREEIMEAAQRFLVASWHNHHLAVLGSEEKIRQDLGVAPVNPLARCV